MSNILWTNDKSGSFITSADKLGFLQLWNVGGKEPQRFIKVGTSGVHTMLPLPGKMQRILIAMKNGAILIYNVAKHRTDFATESGHSETIFDMDYCPSRKDVLASCSYDGTVRIWDVKSMKLMAVNDTQRGSPHSDCEKRIIYSVSWHPT